MYAMVTFEIDVVNVHHLYNIFSDFAAFVIFGGQRSGPNPNPRLFYIIQLNHRKKPLPKKVPKGRVNRTKIDLTLTQNCLSGPTFFTSGNFRGENIIHFFVAIYFHNIYFYNNLCFYQTIIETGYLYPHVYDIDHKITPENAITATFYIKFTYSIWVRLRPSWTWVYKWYTFWDTLLPHKKSRYQNFLSAKNLHENNKNQAKNLKVYGNLGKF